MPMAEELLAARHHAARKLGFSCHAERMLGGKMAGSLQAAQHFCLEMLESLEGLRDPCQERRWKGKAIESLTRNVWTLDEII